MRPMPPIPAAFLAGVIGGCSAESDFALVLDPLVPPNLELTLGDPDASLVHRVGTTATLTPLGPVSTERFGDLPPLEDGVIGLLLSDPGTASDYRPAHLVGYGEAELGGGLASGGEERAITVLMTELGGVGELAEIPRRRAPLFGAATFTPDGRAYFFGGQRDGEPHDRITRIDDLRRGDWEPVELDPLPPIGELSGASVLHQATSLADGTILITGGRPEYFTIANNHGNALLYDPATESVIWQASAGMFPARSRHRALRLRDERVLLVGGWQGPGVDADVGTFQFFDPSNRRFNDAGEVGAGPLGLAVADVGGDGAVVCGGFTFSLSESRLTGTRSCDRITLAGDVLPFPDLPQAVSLGAMAALDDGRILLAGGVLGDIEVPFEDGFLVGANTGPGTDRAWLYEPERGEWREVGSLVEGRAAAEAVPTGDGRFLVIGGAAAAGPMISDDGEPRFCPELFDPDTETFSVTGSCSSPGAGAFPLVSAQPGLGVLVVGGHRVEDNEELGGQAVGLIGLAPPGL